MAFVCLENCGSCCGTIPLDMGLVKRNLHLIDISIVEKTFHCENEVAIITKDGKCVFLNRNTKKCEIYEDRGNLCKKYGLIPALPCPYLRPDGVKRNHKERRKVRQIINKDVDRQMKEAERKANR